MARRRFFVSGFHDGRAELSGEEAFHLTRVLRVAPGQRFEVSDNRRAWLAEVAEARKDRVLFTLIEETPPRTPPLSLALCAALVRFERLEWLFEKGTELGVSRFLLFEAARSEKGLERAAGKRLPRWERILLESSQQARRDRLPELAPPQPLARLLEGAANFRYLLDEEPGAPPLLERLPRPGERRPSHEVSVLVGPEGGWTEAERGQALQAGWPPVSLGNQVLRSETAAIAACAILMAAWNCAPVSGASPETT